MSVPHTETAGGTIALDYAVADAPRLTGQQWKSGIAAWLGWLFDGLDMHLYTLVAAPFVAELLHAHSTDVPEVKAKSAIIMAAFLIGWALGGGFFGRLGDLLGRSRALSLTILVYTLFTGLSFFAQAWWHLLIFRFLAALGIGGEWAVGSSLLAETWPTRWRAWVAAVLQTAVNLGVVLACITNALMSNLPSRRYVFLAGLIPAMLVVWIRRSVPETKEWVEAKARNSGQAPPVGDLFRGTVRRTTLLTIAVCASSLSAWWAFMFWMPQHLRSLPEVRIMQKGEIERLVSFAFFMCIGVSIFGNFFAAMLAKLMGYRRAIMMMFVGFFLAMFGCYIVPRDHFSLLRWVPWVGFFSGVFGLFTMYLPPLFPTLLRTTGAGFSYNIGRVAAAFVTVFFAFFATLRDFRLALLANSLLLIPAIFVALLMPDLRDMRDVEQS